MVDLITVVVQATIRSGLYALIAIGFTLIFGVGGVLNLAHGASIVIGAYAAWYVGFQLGLGAAGAALAALLIPALFGAVLYLGIIKRFQEEPIMVMILTLVTSVAIEQIVRVRFGTEAKLVPQFVDGNSISIGGASVQPNLIAIFVLSWVLIIGLFLFINYTRWGKATLATSMSDKGASLVGIRSNRINLATWIIAGALAGIAGMALGSQQLASFTMGRNPLVLSFSIVVIGGIGSIRGSLVGAYLIGFLEVFVLQFVSNSLTGLAPLVVLVLVLLVKPEGLFGRELAE